jgi:hypothetical protein
LKPRALEKNGRSVRLAFALPRSEHVLVDDDARWLVNELTRGDEASVAFAGRLERAVPTGERVRPTAAEMRTLLQIFERSPHARTRDLRNLEVALNDAIFRR